MSRGAWLEMYDGPTDHPEWRNDSISVKTATVDFGFTPAWSFSLPHYDFHYGGGRLLGLSASKFGCEVQTEEFGNWVQLVFGQYVGLRCKSTVPLHLRMRSGNDTFVAEAMSTPFEVYGDDGNDYLRSSNGPDTLRGGNGTDTLRGGPGVDSLFGNADEDVVDGGTGADVISCGGGVDLVQYQGRGSALTVTLDGVRNDGASAENDKIVNDCENVESGSGSDTITGSVYANKLLGRDGNDTLKGGNGDDRLYGGNGTDKLFGEAGDDNLYGEAGNDIIDGGSGQDAIYGGHGDDTINAKDGSRDIITCGEGTYDVVVYDAGLDQIDASCEQS